MKTILCLILATSLALTSAYSARPQFNKQQSNNYNAKKSYQQPAASTNNYHKASTSLPLSSSSSEKESQILHNDMEMKGDGTYHYDFETSNGIKRTEQGAVDGTIQGSSSYISPEGVEIKTTYVADETGYHPVGDHIPQIPDYIVRALEYIRTHPYIEKDYYTGEVKQTSFSNKKSLPIATTKRSAYNNNLKKANSNNSKYNFRH
ncbi:pupal cuticle protein [Lucilia sericata]|uniref:pupal cuticle protein n=1 Tax=Lucilia sericata TaxID=13632 RepID=UPI0018A840DA|nr:pupal cuticle protein [Lucilia sericata]